MQERILLFSAVRSIKLLFKTFLEMLQELKADSDNNIQKIDRSLFEVELFLKEHHNVEINLTHLVKHAQFFDDEKVKAYRKRVLDLGNGLLRELDERGNF